MVGRYEIEVYNNRVHFYLEVKRNITIIQGDSATGKTTLIGLIADHDRLGSGSGVTVKSEKPCTALNTQDWKHFIESRKQHIIFVDENMPMLRSNEFAEVVASSDNYFVIIYRDSLPKLAYSIEEIFGMREDRNSQKYIKPKRVYNTLFHIYSLDEGSISAPDIVITEDSNSGFEFYDASMNCRCIAAGGKSSVTDEMMRHTNEGTTIMGVVDGAAFGSDMQRFSRLARSTDGKLELYAPESFEYLLLQSGIIDVDKRILENTYDYADSTEYLSWERYFTAKLSELTRNTVYQYSKQKLNQAYLTEGNVKKILQITPDMVRKKAKKKYI